METRNVILRVFGAGAIAVISCVLALKVLKAVPLWAVLLIGMLPAAACSFLLFRKKSN
jgi:uncharacterized protein (DUF983 family)